MLHPRARSLEEDLELAAAGKLGAAAGRVAAAPAAGPAAGDGGHGEEDGDDGPGDDAGERRAPAARERRRVRFAVPDDGDGEEEDDPFKRLDAHERRGNVPEILQEIQERDDIDATMKMFLPGARAGGAGADDGSSDAFGFPKAFRAKPSAAAAGQQEPADQPKTEAGRGRRKVSLFKQMMLEKRGEEVPLVDAPGAEGVSAAPALSFPSEAPIEAPMDAGAFSLDKMSPAQIAQAQDEIRSQFDPEILSRFMAKMNGSKPASPSAHVDAAAAAADERKSAREAREAKLKDLSWIRSEEQLDEAVNMLPMREREKLRWTGRIRDPAPGADDKPDDVVEDLAARGGMRAAGAESIMPANFRTSIESARFDLEGNFIAASSAETGPQQSALYHHGDEPDRAGYTIIELAHLARSKAAAQKALALSCIAKILRKRHIGLYGEGTPAEDERRSVLVNGSHPLFSLPDQLGVIVRMGLDSSNPSVAVAAIEALEAFLVPTLHLDALFDVAAYSLGRFLPAELPRAQGAQDVFARAFDSEPLTSAQSREAETGQDDDEDGVEDTDAVVQSPVGGMLRIGLIERIRFLLRVDRKMAVGVDLSADLIDRCLAMLTTIVLHSDAGAAFVAQAPGLLGWIAERLGQSLDTSSEGSDACIRLAYALSASKREFASLLAQVSGKVVEERVRSGARPLARQLLRVWRAMGVVHAAPASASNGTVVLYRTHGAAAVAVEGQISDATAEIWAGRACAEAFMCAHAYLGQLNSGVGSAGGREYSVLMKLEDLTMAQDLCCVKEGQEAPARLRIADRAVAELLSAVRGRLETILPTLLENLSIEVADEVLLLLDLLLDLVKREDVRSECHATLARGGVRDNMEALLLEAQLPEELDAARGSSTPTPQQICVQRTFTMVWLRATQVLTRVFGLVRESSESEDDAEGEQESLEQRRAMLAESVPVLNPRTTGEEWAVAEIVEALVSPTLQISGPQEGSGLLRAPVVACLGGERAVAASRALAISGLGTGVVGEALGSLRLGHYRTSLSAAAQKADAALGRRWQEARSAWVLLPLFVAFRPEGAKVVPQAIAAAHQLLQDGAVSPEDLVLAVARVLSAVEAPPLMDDANARALTQLVSDALNDLREAAQASATDLSQIIEDAAGGKGSLMKLWEALIAAYNETLNGHPTATALLLLMLRTAGDRDLRLVVWSEMADANLLRLLQPSAELTSLPAEELFHPEETWDEIIQCIARSLCSNILTGRNNAFLFKVAIRVLAQFFWLHQSSWNRRRILRMLVLEGPFEQVATCIVDESHQRDPEGLHPNAVAALRAVAREDDLTRAKIAIAFPSVLAVSEGEEDEV